MARYSDDEMGEYYAEEFSEDQTEQLNEILFDIGGTGDERAQQLFQEAFFDGDENAYQDLVDYLYDVYGLDFEDAFDWADFRAWYDAA